MQGVGRIGCFSALLSFPESEGSSGPVSLGPTGAGAVQRAAEVALLGTWHELRSARDVFAKDAGRWEGSFYVDTVVT